MFPKAQKRPKGVFGTKWEPEGPIPLNILIISSLFFLYAVLCMPLEEKHVGLEINSNYPFNGNGRELHGELHGNIPPTRSLHNPAINLSQDAIYRNQSVTARITVDGDTSKLWCEIFYSWDSEEDKDNWSVLSSKLIDDVFEGHFQTTHATSAGFVYFYGRVGNITADEYSYTTVAEVNVMNNPPNAFLTVNPDFGIIGGELYLSGEGCFDIDGNVGSFRWFLDDVELNADNSYPNMTYRVGNMIVKKLNFTCEVTDNEGGVSKSKPVAVEIIGNNITSGEIILYDNEGCDPMKGGGVVKGEIILEGNFTDYLGLDSVEINISKAGEGQIIYGKVTLREGGKDGLHIWQSTSSEGITTFWSYRFDTSELDDGNYSFELSAKNGISSKEINFYFNVRNTPPATETHFWSFLSIGIGMFTILGLAGFFINRSNKRRVRKILSAVGNESKEIFRSVPAVSMISLLICIVLLSFLFAVTIIHTGSWLIGLSLIFAIGISGLFSYLVLNGKSLIICFLGIILSLGTGILLVLLFDKFIWGLIGLVLCVLIMLAEIVCYFLFNRYYLMSFQNRVENTTSAGTNMSLNAFEIRRRYGQDKKKDTKTDRINVFGKISYTLFNNKEVKIGVFDVKDWGRDEKVAGIMLGKFMKMMKKKQHNAPFADSIEITVLGSDPSRQRKKEIILGRGFRKTDVKEQRRGETYRYEIPRG